MNNLLKIKLKFASEKKAGGFSERNFTSDRYTDIKKINSLIENLNAIKIYYKSQKQLVKNALVDVCYNDIIAKSNRTRELLKGVRATDHSIVGARFSDAEDGFENHIITHYIEFAAIDSTIEKLEFAKKFLSERLNGRADKENFNKPKARVNYNGYPYKETKIRDIIIDCSVIDRFDIPRTTDVQTKENMLITFYKTELNMEEILQKIGVDHSSYIYNKYGDYSLSVDATTFNKI